MNQTPLIPPARIPELGFYYHYKHDPAGPENVMAYEVTGIGWHTETQEFSVMYRPLYAESGAYTGGKLTYLRPVEMFMEMIEKPDYNGPRFIPITDPGLVERLTALRTELYGQA